MKRSAKPPHRQMNLPLLHGPAPTAVPGDQQKELTCTLMELLLSAAQESLETQQTKGGENETPEAHA
jgi:hypothetical protein